MDGQRQRSGGGRKRRRKARSEPRAAAEPVLIAARRPDSPLLQPRKGRGRSIAASATPAVRPLASAVAAAPTAPSAVEEAPRRTARIVTASNGSLDDRERQRRRLLDRLLAVDVRGAVSRAADEYLGSGFDLPDEQTVHLQLLEHFDETRVRDALGALGRLLCDEAPIKRPVLDQRLRRIEEYADEAPTRTLAAQLRRSIRA
jgi:hypothetical protein